MATVELTENVLVPCPERGFAYRKVKNCLDCQHYKGIINATCSGKQIEGDEADVYQIVCGRPISRKLIKICED